MSARNQVPDAWDDDDWGDKVDEPKSAPPAATKPAKLSKAERRARQAEFNRQLWEDAESPGLPYYVQSRDTVPLQSDIKPAVKLLSRKPAPTIVAKRDSVTGLEKLTIEDDDDDDDDDSGKVKPLTLEERQLKAQKEREEKRRLYGEARERIFGTSNPSSGTNTPGTVTPPRGGRGGRIKLSRGSRPSSSSSAKGKQLYDPDYSAKPTSIFVQRQHSDRDSDSQSKQEDDQVIRQPRGPDQSGRGGFGFAGRGKTS